MTFWWISCLPETAIGLTFNPGHLFITAHRDVYASRLIALRPAKYFSLAIAFLYRD